MQFTKKINYFVLFRFVLLVFFVVGLVFVA